MKSIEEERERAIGELMKYKAFFKNELKTMMAYIDQTVIEIDRGDSFFDFSKAYETGIKSIINHQMEMKEDFKKLKPKRD